VSAIRKGSWKLIYFHKTSELELYNLKDDIAEQRDLSKLFPQKLKEMAALMTLELKKKMDKCLLSKKRENKFPGPTN